MGIRNLDIERLFKWKLILHRIWKTHTPVHGFHIGRLPAAISKPHGIWENIY